MKKQCKHEEVLDKLKYICICPKDAVSINCQLHQHMHTGYNQPLHVTAVETSKSAKLKTKGKTATEIHFKRNGDPTHDFWAEWFENEYRSKDLND